MNTAYNEKNTDYYAQTRDDLIKYIPAGLKKILDVGCSNGNFGIRLKREFGIEEAWGIEPFEEAAEEAKPKLDKVINRTAEEGLKEIPENYFDCIFFNDVLEHLVNPEDVLVSVKKSLNPKGVIFASIPNVLQFKNIYTIIRQRDFQYASFGIMDKTHLRFFTRKSIERMFKSAGYTIMSINGINPVVTPRYKLLRLIFGKKFEDFKFIQFVVIAKK